MSDRTAKVLVVDDDELQLELVQRSLGHEGFEVMCASEPESIESHARTFAPDVVLLDLSVPGAVGGAVVEMLRNAAPSARIWLYSASDDAQLRALAKKHGTDGWLSKSRPVTELARQLRDGSARSGNNINKR